MSLGTAVVLRVVGALFTFVGELCVTLAEFAEALGNPEISTPCALVVVGLYASGRKAQALFAFLLGSLIDLVGKELARHGQGPVCGAPRLPGLPSRFG